MMTLMTPTPRKQMHTPNCTTPQPKHTQTRTTPPPRGRGGTKQTQTLNHATPQGRGGTKDQQLEPHHRARHPNPAGDDDDDDDIARQTTYHVTAHEGEGSPYHTTGLGEPHHKGGWENHAKGMPKGVGEGFQP